MDRASSLQDLQLHFRNFFLEWKLSKGVLERWQMTISAQNAVARTPYVLYTAFPVGRHLRQPKTARWSLEAVSLEITILPGTVMTAKTSGVTGKTMSRVSESYNELFN